MNKKIKRECYCGKEFKVWPVEIRKGGGKFCGQSCYRRRVNRSKPYRITHGFASKKNKFLRNRWSTIVHRLKRVSPGFKPQYLSEDYWKALMICEIAIHRVGMGRKLTIT